MTTWIDSLLNKHLNALKPYESARRLYSGGQDWLNANESPYANDYSLDTSALNRYPDCQPKELINAYADYASVSSSQLIATRGADEGIELLIRTFCTPGKDKVLICPPTYGMYAISAETCNIGVERVPLNADFSINVEAVCAHKDVNIVFICSPNNPTGTLVNAHDIHRIATHFKGSALVVVDEAYIEFSMQQGWPQHINEFDNVVVLRTLSKAFALAGLRCGFTIAPEPIIQCLMKVIAPYPVPNPVAQIAHQALTKNGLDVIRKQVAKLNTLRSELGTALDKRSELDVIGSANANFILFRCKDKDGLMSHLVANGMLIRDQSKQFGLDNCLRATIGEHEQQTRLLSLIESFYANRRAA